MYVFDSKSSRLLKRVCSKGDKILRFVPSLKNPVVQDFKPLPYPQTPQSAAAWFKRNGVCKAHWARYFGLERSTVEHLLRGKLKGNFGKSHEAAVKLGLKENLYGGQ